MFSMKPCVVCVALKKILALIPWTMLCIVLLFHIMLFTIAACSYWNDQKLGAVAEYEMLIYQESLNDGNEFTCDYMPQVINIYGWTSCYWKPSKQIIPNTLLLGRLESICILVSLGLGLL